MNSNSSLPKYKTIIEDILVRIQKNDFTYDVPLCTEQSLMDEYGVSRITATRALTELLQRGILYRKRGVGSFVTKSVALNNLTNAPSAADPKTISFLIPFDLTTPLVSEIARIVTDGLSERGYFMNVYICNASLSREKANLKLLLSQNPSGIIYLPFRDKIFINLLNEFVMQNKPVIILDKYTDCPYIHNITSDNFDGGRLLTEHLLSLGHRNITFFTTAPVEDVSSVRNRFGGYLDGLHRAGLSPAPGNLVYLPCDLGNEPSEEFPNPQITAFLNKSYEQGVTAVLTENDIVADYLCRACEQLGFRVPQDFSICGFDDTDFARRLHGGITTVKQDYPAIAVELLNALNEALTNPAAGICRKNVPVSLVIRSSTGPARITG